MQESFQGLLPLVVGPLVGAFVSIVTTSSGLSGKTKDLDYQIKRVELIEKLLASIGEDSDRLRKALKFELAEIISYVRETSIQEDELTKITYDQRIWYKKIVPPYSNTIEGKLANIVFYLYGCTTLLYIIMMPFLLLSRRIEGEFGWVVMVSVVGSFLLAILARIWAISAARRYALLRRARRLLILYSNTRGEGPM